MSASVFLASHQIGFASTCWHASRVWKVSGIAMNWWSKESFCLAFDARSLWEHGAGLFVNSAWSSANDWGLEKYVRLSCQGLTCFTKNKEGHVSSTLQFYTLAEGSRKNMKSRSKCLALTGKNHSLKCCYSTDALCQAKLYFHGNEAEATREKHTIVYK